MEAVFARREHGGHRVVLSPKGYEVEWPTGSRVYPSARQLLIALVNRNPDPPKGAADHRLTFDRYFRRGKYQSWVPPQDTLALFQPDPPNQISIPTPKPLRVDSSLTVLVEEPEIKLGIDLENRSIEVRKLFYAGFSRKMLAKGYDPEDVLQDVYVALAVRNRGKCPFDPRKSSFSHYVYMVCGCVCSNYHRRYGRLTRNEQFGVPVVGEDEYSDVANADLAVEEAGQEDAYQLLSATSTLTIRVVEEAPLAGIDPTLAERCIEFLFEGWRYREISEVMGCSIGKVSEAVKFVRKVATEWRAEMGI